MQAIINIRNRALNMQINDLAVLVLNILER
jgi:hypothetical protein